ncbi:MAG: Holliday junction branch migration protein RuvA [Burkholderiaceae bacterium]
MIGRLQGNLVEKRPPSVVLDVNGVGYEVDVPMSTYYDLPALTGNVTLLTHLVVREDAQLLFGFLTESERSAFRQLIKISGVGARMALAILSGLSVQDLSVAIAEQDSARLTRVPGIGKKTADRLILELNGKFAAPVSAGNGTGSDEPGADVLNALLALGYSDKEARTATRKLPADGTVSDGIRLALKQLAK